MDEAEVKVVPGHRRQLKVSEAREEGRGEEEDGRARVVRGVADVDDTDIAPTPPPVPPPAPARIAARGARLDGR